MARIEGTGATRQTRWRRPKVRFEPLVMIAVLSPVVLIAPNDWFAAIALAGAIAASWWVGHEDGRSDHAREVLRDLRRNDGAA